MVDVPPEYRIIVELSSLMVATKDSTAPESIPGSIRIAVVLKNVRIGGSPSDMDASSITGSI